MKPIAGIEAPEISEAEMLIRDEATEEELRAYRARLISLEARNEALAYVSSVSKIELFSGAAGPSVYFVRAGSDGPIKIGQTDNAVTDRLRTLQTGNHNELQLMACSRLLSERRLHQIFAHLRIRGEWFKAEPELLSAVLAASALPADEQVVAATDFGAALLAMTSAGELLAAQIGAKIDAGQKTSVSESEIAALRLVQRMIGAALEWMESIEHGCPVDMSVCFQNHGVDLGGLQ